MTMFQRWLCLLVLFQCSLLEWNRLVAAYPTIDSEISLGSSEMMSPNYQPSSEQYQDNDNSNNNADLYGQQLLVESMNNNGRNGLKARHNRRSSSDSTYQNSIYRKPNNDQMHEQVIFTNDTKLLQNHLNLTALKYSSYYVSGVLNLHACHDSVDQNINCNFYCNRTDWNRLFRNECGKTAYKMSITKPAKKRFSSELVYDSENPANQKDVIHALFGRNRRSHLFLTPDIFNPLVLPPTQHWKTVWGKFLALMDECCVKKPALKCTPYYMRASIMKMCVPNVAKSGSVINPF